MFQNENNGIFKNLPMISHHSETKIKAPSQATAIRSTLVAFSLLKYPKEESWGAPASSFPPLWIQRLTAVKQHGHNPALGKARKPSPTLSEAPQPGLCCPRQSPPPGSGYSQAGKQVRFYIGAVGGSQGAGLFCQDLPRQVSI
jgi:hypothetical protein